MTVSSADRKARRMLQIARRNKGRRHELHMRSDGLPKTGYSWSSYKTRRRKYVRRVQ